MQDCYFSRTGPQLREKFLPLQVLIPLVDSVSSAIMRRRRTRLCNCGRRSDHHQQHWMKQRFHGNSSDDFTHCITLTLYYANTLRMAWMPSISKRILPRSGVYCLCNIDHLHAWHSLDTRPVSST